MHAHRFIQHIRVLWKNENRLAIDANGASPMAGLMSDLLQKVVDSEYNGEKLQKNKGVWSESR